MRPRVFPAEDTLARCRKGETHDGFNEAAGIPRGRLLIPRKPWVLIPRLQ